MILVLAFLWYMWLSWWPWDTFSVGYHCIKGKCRWIASKSRQGERKSWLWELHKNILITDATNRDGAEASLSFAAVEGSVQYNTTETISDVLVFIQWLFQVLRNSSLDLSDASHSSAHILCYSLQNTTSSLPLQAAMKDRRWSIEDV